MGNYVRLGDVELTKTGRIPPLVREAFFDLLYNLNSIVPPRYLTMRHISVNKAGITIDVETEGSSSRCLIIKSYVNNKEVGVTPTLKNRVEQDKLERELRETFPKYEIKFLEA